MNNYKTAVLRRIEQTAKCVRGVLTIDNRYVCMTLERPWLDNKPNISCIPFGLYICRRIISPHFGTTFEVQGVPGRSHILIHAGNSPKDTEGCILLGKTLPPHVAEIRESRAALNTFKELLAGIDNFQMDVIA